MMAGRGGPPRVADMESRVSEADRLQALITTVRRRWFTTVALRTAGTAMAAASVPILLGLAVYRMLSPAAGGLLLLASAATLLSVAAVWLVARRIEPRPDDTRVARFIEEHPTIWNEDIGEPSA